MNQNTVLTAEDRAAVLDLRLQDMVSSGDRVALRTPFSAVLVTGRPVHHFRHFVASFLCWVWVLVWAFHWLLGGERRVTVTVAPDGAVEEHLQTLSFLKRLVAILLVGGWALLVGVLLTALYWLTVRR